MLLHNCWPRCLASRQKRMQLERAAPCMARPSPCMSQGWGCSVPFLAATPNTRIPWGPPRGVAIAIPYRQRSVLLHRSCMHRPPGSPLPAPPHGRLQGPAIAIFQEPSVMDAMNTWCIEHHGKSGLTQRVHESTTSMREAEDKVGACAHVCVCCACACVCACAYAYARVCDDFGATGLKVVKDEEVVGGHRAGLCLGCKGAVGMCVAKTTRPRSVCCTSSPAHGRELRMGTGSPAHGRELRMGTTSMQGGQGRCGSCPWRALHGVLLRGLSKGLSGTACSLIPVCQAHPPSAQPGASRSKLGPG